jgi:hypothetical protein
MTTLKGAFRGRVPVSLCALVLASTALLTSCKDGPVPLATVNYAEMSVCAANGGNQPDAPDTLIILVFEITSISNTDAGASSFTFNPNLLYLSGDNGDDYAATNESAASGLSLTGAPFGFARTRTVPAGSTATVNAGVVVTDTVAANSSTMNDRNTSDFQLLYATPSGAEGVLLVKTNDSAAKYPTISSWGCPHYL